MHAVELARSAMNGVQHLYATYTATITSALTPVKADASTVMWFQRAAVRSSRLFTVIPPCAEGRDAGLFPPGFVRKKMQALAVAFLFQFRQRDEAQCRRVDAVAQAAAVRWAV